MAELEAYRQKRDFSKTPEPPPGEADAAAQNLVFVVQQHRATRMHWDFRLEVDGVLKSWPLPKGPSLNPKDKRMAVMVEDHPYDYRTFEGVIPRKEYGAGEVIVWDEGAYCPDEPSPCWDDKEEANRRMREGIAKGKLSFTMRGHKLRGSFALVKTGYDEKSWLLIKHRDEYASTRDVLEEDRSVRSGLTVVDIKEGKLPPPPGASLPAAPSKAERQPLPSSRDLGPMLSTLVDRAFDRPGWLWEPKLDGVRALAFVQDGKVELRSRRGNDMTKQYPALVAALARQGGQPCIFDGEICALDETGVPNFHRLQNRINLTKPAEIAVMDVQVPVVYYVFDALHLDGADLRNRPLAERKQRLWARLDQDENVRYVSHIEASGTEVEASARTLGFEGVIGKRADSRYEPGARSKAWLKVKTTHEQEFVVAGYTPGEGARASTFGALALGYYDEDGVLRYAGNVGSGFNDVELATVKKRLGELKSDASPFPRGTKVEGDVRWLEPRMVVRVKYGSWTDDGHLRAPVFEGLRDDIDPLQVGRDVAAPAEVIAEATVAVSTPVSGNGKHPPGNPSPVVAAVLDQLNNPKSDFTLDFGDAKVKLTNLDKVFWPAHGDAPPYTKRDLVRYYVELAATMLPHLKDRPLTLTRYPNGITGGLFYQKHYAQPIPSFVDTVSIWSSHNEGDGTYILCNNLPTLVWLAQIADLEIHAWMSSVTPGPDAPDHPRTFAGSETAIDASVLNFPDYMVFDLDPYIYSGAEAKGEEPEYNRRGWEKTVEIALSLKDVLDQLRLSSYIKTSGKTGLHVYVPLLRHYDYDAVRAATQTIGRFMVQQHPKDLTMEWDTSKRRGKVFFDYNQNSRGKNMAAQYSLRPTAWAGVSTPILWSELKTLDPAAFTIATVPKRVADKGDLWGDILAHRNDLAALIGGGN